MHVGCCYSWLRWGWTLASTQKNLLVKGWKGERGFRAINNYDWSWYREALAEFAEMKAREEKKARLEQEEKRQAYLARKMHYLLSTSQVSLRPEQRPWATWGPAQQRLTSSPHGPGYWSNNHPDSFQNSFQFRPMQLCKQALSSSLWAPSSVGSAPWESSALRSSPTHPPSPFNTPQKCLLLDISLFEIPIPSPLSPLRVLSCMLLELSTCWDANHTITGQTQSPLPCKVLASECFPYGMWHHTCSHPVASGLAWELGEEIHPS